MCVCHKSSQHIINRNIEFGSDSRKEKFYFEIPVCVCVCSLRVFNHKKTNTFHHFKDSEVFFCLPNFFFLITECHTKKNVLITSFN